MGCCGSSPISPEPLLRPGKGIILDAGFKISSLVAVGVAICCKVRFLFTAGKITACVTALTSV